MTSPKLHVLRQFNWGLLLLCDQGARDLPTAVPVSPAVATATSTAIAVAVRHAQDVEADGVPREVAVDVFVDEAGSYESDFHCTLRIDTGVLEVGDADRFDALELQPGTWLVDIIALPTDHPEHVVVRLAPSML